MADTERTITTGRKPTLMDLINKKLDGFSIRKFTEIYKKDDDGRKKDIVGFLEDADIANAYMATLPDPGYHEAVTAYVLTNGTVAFRLGEPVTLIDEGVAKDRVRDAALRKLGPAERKALGLA